MNSYFEFRLNLIPIPREFGHIGIMTSSDYTSIFYPLKTSFIITSSTTLTNDKVLKFLIFTSQLSWYGFEIFTYPELVSGGFAGKSFVTMQKLQYIRSITKYSHYDTITIYKSAD